MISTTLNNRLQLVKAILCTMVLTLTASKTLATEDLLKKSSYQYELFKEVEQRANLVEMLFSDNASNLLDNPQQFKKHYKAQQEKYKLPKLGKSKYSKAQGDALKLLINAGKHYAANMKKYNYNSKKALAHLPQDEQAVIKKIDLKGSHLQNIEKKTYTVAIYEQATQALENNNFDQLLTNWPLASVHVRGNKLQTQESIQVTHSFLCRVYCGIYSISLRHPTKPS